MPMSQDLYAVWKAKEKEEFEKIRAKNPELLERPAPPDPDMILGMIGVTYLPETRTRGYIRLYPQDFIVEEVTKDGTLSSLVSTPSFRDSEDRRTLYADLVKAGIAHHHAFHDLETLLGLPEGGIAYAGIKDSVALTSQRIALRGVSKEKLEAISHPHLWLKPVAYGSGSIQIGDLQGNRFTITVRTEEGRFDERLIDILATVGGYNFFGPQRFGLRVNSHRLGQKLLQGDIDGVLHAYFTQPGPFDVPLFRQIRESFDAVYGDWTRMKKLALFLPSSFGSEIRVLAALEQDPKKTRAALGAIRDQVKLWQAAYSSWVVNRHLSRLIQSGEELPDELPLPLAPGGIPKGYADLIDGDGTTDYEDVIAMFPFLQTSTKTIPTRLQAKNVAWEAIPQGVVMRFELGKGSYATSFLSHAFRLYEGLPVPDWVQEQEVDGLAVIGDGAIDEYKKRFSKVLVRRDAFKDKDSEE
ncbi:MAG TPA: tRNA pseudouridine(13) synthase TruD [Verrucomicrobiae bacterium]|nr:tRNA pseudouridine(13) synthase TruD [Verrucomicrobiae bacterium]